LVLKCISAQTVYNPVHN